MLESKLGPIPRHSPFVRRCSALSKPRRGGGMGRAATFRQSDVERVIKTLQRTGLGVSKVLVENGRVIVLPLTAPEPEAHPDDANAWDDLLPDDKA